MQRWLLAFAVVTTLALSACSSSESEPGAGGTGGTAQSGAGQANLAGMAGRSANAGRGTSGGASGSGGERGGGAGRAGSGGAGGSGGRIGAGGAGGGAGTSSGSGSSGEAGSAQSGSGGGAPDLTGCVAPVWFPDQFDTVIDVGPGFDHETPSDVPWESLTAGTLVRIHGRAEPYRDKWVINSTGTADKPIVVLGIVEDGVLPVISGEDASTRAELEYWNEERGIIKIGGSDAPSGPAAYVTIECLDVTTARPGTSFEAADGSESEYAENAACLYIEDGAFVTLRNNRVHGCGNGIFASSGSSDLVVTGNHVYDNGNAGSIYEHNSYTEALGITFIFNRYGPLCAGCEGNNLKDRSAGTVIAYNWIEAGNRQLDLVESDHDELIDDPRYRETFVYGNVLIEPDAAGNSQIVHYGGDGGDESKYRKGALYFYGNTVVSTRGGNTTLFRLSSQDESVNARNNIVSVTAGGDTLAISAGMGALALATNWLPSDWVESHDTFTGTLDEQNNLTGDEPGFRDAPGQDFNLANDSSCLGAAGPLHDAARISHPLTLEYVRHQSSQPRTEDLERDIGAFEAVPVRQSKTR